MKFQTGQTSATPLYFNVTSFVDILMVLVIFMLVAWSTARIESDVGIQLPTSSSSTPRNPSPVPVIVNVRADGGMSVNQKPITDEELIQMLGKLAQLQPGQVAVVRADRQVPYERVLKVLDYCREAGISQVGFSALIATPDSKN
ncbi:MAG: biopolymer transporter ExbD [Chthoniobacterales bacterium]|nr:biopolymer transporter ExbD [Chthoniobacterales bacterium]